MKDALEREKLEVHFDSSDIIQSVDASGEDCLHDNVGIFYIMQQSFEGLADIQQDHAKQEAKRVTHSSHKSNSDSKVFEETVKSLENVSVFRRVVGKNSL